MNVPATFIGIDLAWKSERNPSGAVVLRQQEDGAALIDVAAPLRSLDEVLAYVAEHEKRPSVVAVDAPLIIVNPTGQRVCERLIGKCYGARDASCHTSNRALYPEPASARFVDALAAMGYVHAVGHGSPGAAGVMMEVYPHAAMVALFDLPRIIKYKKGRVSDKRAGLRRLQQLLWLLIHHDPPLVATDSLRWLLGQPINALRGKELKNYEDSLDALMCAYVAYHYWVWGGARTEVFGDVTSGYIANPRLQVGWGRELQPADAVALETHHG